MPLLPLPLTPAQVHDLILPRALEGRFRSARADVQLLAIGLQESKFKYRRQMGNGPAKGLWQFERGGGCAGVLRHPSSKSYMEHACREHGVAPTAAGLWNALETDDLLACKAARLLLWTDPSPLPALGDVWGAWEYYKRNWRPGKPHPEFWAANYAAALRVAQ